MLFWLRRYNALDWPAVDAIAPALVVGYFFGARGMRAFGRWMLWDSHGFALGQGLSQWSCAHARFCASDADLRDDSDGLYFRDSVGSARSSQARYGFWPLSRF